VGFRVEAQALSKTYTSGRALVAALSEASLDVEAGGAVAVTGPSGSGKSTLLHLIGAMERPDSGRILVDERDVGQLTPGAQVQYRRTIGFVFQRFHLLPALTVVDNVAAPLIPYRTPFDKHERACELLDAVGLAGRESALPAELSGGEQQRVAIARALVNEPGLILADEPTGNLDSVTGAEIVDLLLRIRAERGATVVLVTHSAVLAARCDRVIRLLDGRVHDDVDVSVPVEPDAVLERISRMDG
jgi:putative ABC transport system ATP-binding protein